MKKHPRLSTIFVAVTAASLALVSSASFAMHGKRHVVENYKGEANYKAEVPPPCPPIKLLLDGFYVGAGVSYDSYRFNRSFNRSDDDGDSVSFSNHISSRGWDGEINLGYGRYWDMFYLGGEIHGVISGADGSSNATFTDSDGDNVSINVNAKARGSYALSLLPGIKVNDSTLVYVRLGWIRTDFKVNGSINTNDPDFGNRSASRSKWKNGFLGGVGTETYIADNVSLRGEYQYSAYSSTSSNNGGGSVKPSNSSFTLGIQYHFA